VRTISLSSAGELSVADILYYLAQWVESTDIAGYFRRIGLEREMTCIEHVNFYSLQVLLKGFRTCGG
jgi:hypothetical protein